MALRTPLSVTPHLYMGDSTGRPLDMGTVYFGEPDKDPEFYPITLYSDDALTLPLAQPVHTKGGYLYDKGDMVEPHAKELIYSVKVLDSYGRKVFYKGAMMRNSWNDDVIEQINTALVSTAEEAAQIATDVAKEIADKAVISSGFVTVDSFEIGAIITQRNQALRHAATGNLYRWAGNLPKVVSTNSTPTSSGGMGDNAWLEVSDTALRQELSAPSGGLFIPNIVIEFASLQSALNASWLPVGTTVKTISYHDGWAAQVSPPKGGNTYIKVAGGTGVADGGAYIDCSDGTQLKGLFPDGTLSISQYGAKSDGITDDVVAVNNAIRSPLELPAIVPVGITCVSDTVNVGARGKVLNGASDALFPYRDGYASCELRWIGGIEPKKALILVGSNSVGAEPTIDSTANVCTNLYLNGNDKVGFLMYGTYLTNETLIRRVAGHGSTEYNFYFARGWYATIDTIVSKSCRNNGVALGMPLIYSDGERVSWTTASPYELNQCKTTNIRSIDSGSTFKSVANQGVWNPIEYRFQGYGIGAGEGNGFRLSDYLSEKSGGVNLLSWSTFSPSKVIEKGYHEISATNSQLDVATNCPSMILDYSEHLAGALGHEYRDIFINYQTGGIITFKNDVGSEVLFSNIQQPRFLIDGTGETGLNNHKNPKNWIKRENCYYMLGLYNNRGRIQLHEKLDVNTRYTWSVDIPYSDHSKMVQIRTKSATYAPSGSIRVTKNNGSTYTINFPPTLEKDVWFDLYVVDFSEVKLESAGTLASVNTLLDFRIVTLPRTDIWS